jgi:hypothetical protein
MNKSSGTTARPSRRLPPLLVLRGRLLAVLAHLRRHRLGTHSRVCGRLAASYQLAIICLQRIFRTMRRFTTGRSATTAPKATDGIHQDSPPPPFSASGRRQELLVVISGRLGAPVEERLAACAVVVDRDLALREAALEDLYGAFRCAGCLVGR